MRFADVQYSQSMCEDFAISVSEVFELTEKQTEKLKKEITTLVQEEIELNV